MDELKQQDEERKLNQETSAAGKSVSNVDPRSWEDDEPEIPEEPDEPDPTDPTDPTDPWDPGTDIPTEPTLPSPWE